MLNMILSIAILIVFTGLLAVGAYTTTRRSYRYARLGMRQPVLLPRDRDLLVGLTFPFVVISVVRAFGLQEFIRDPETLEPHIWYLLLTGIPPIYALVRYDFYELFVIERARPASESETVIQRQDRQVGDARRDSQRRDGQ